METIMGVREILKELVEELDRVHGGAMPWSEEYGIPDFVTANNGMQRFFTPNAKKLLRKFSNTLHENRPANSLNVELESYEKVVRQVIADMHAAGEFSGFDEKDEGNLLHRLKELSEKGVAKKTHEFTHYFPAWTLGMEKDSPFTLGPITIMSRDFWIDSVDFPLKAKQNYLNLPDFNHKWKEILKGALQNPNDSVPVEGLANTVYSSVSECPALVKVTTQGCELEFSGKLARLVAKTALDAISLGFGAPECFLLQALQDERLPPVGYDRLVETEGYLWLPGKSLGKRVVAQPPDRVRQALADMEEILPVFSTILEGLLDPTNHPHPKLSNRWATALDWFGEGNRESSDAIALAKLGTCLDVLSCGGKNKGIRDMVVHLTGVDSDTQVIGGDNPRTLKNLIKDIYDHGRSKILHGTHYDRLKTFESEREYAVYLGRIALIESAQRLQSYCGPDEEKAFRTI